MALIKLLYLVRQHCLSLMGAIILGTLGHITAIMIPVMGVYGLLVDKTYIYWVLVFALLRAVLRYTEQYLNHLVAFKILAHIRSILFEKLRSLAPAIMDSKDRGDLVSMVSSDVELLEVFYAHTISPIFIALMIMVFVGFISPNPGVTLLAHLLVGFMMPLVLMVLSQRLGDKHRESFARLSSLSFEYTQGYETLKQFKALDGFQTRMKEEENKLSYLTSMMALVDGLKRVINEVIMWGGAFLIIVLYKDVSIRVVLLTLVVHLSSFGPVLSLSSLIQNLYHTMACSKRVLALLEEKPLIEDVTDSLVLEDIEGVHADGVSFTYNGEDMVLDDFSLELNKGQFIGVSGSSGSGKSTLVKLLARIYDPIKGSIKFNKNSIDTLNTKSLRQKQSLMSQENMIFSRSVFENVAMVKEGAQYDDVVKACKKASIHDFIMSLEDGYDTKIDHAGRNLSAGEKQRLALARVFLHDGDLILLDEVTSNLDYLNERMVMKSLSKLSKDKILVMVSHRRMQDKFINSKLEL